MYAFVCHFSYNHSSVHTAFAAMPRRMMPECNPHYILSAVANDVESRLAAGWPYRIYAVLQQRRVRQSIPGHRYQSLPYRCMQ